MTTALVFGREFLLHEQSPSHPERRERLAYTIDQLEEEGLFHHNRVRVIPPIKATRGQVEVVHHRGYIAFLEEASGPGGSSTMTRWSRKACWILPSLQREAQSRQASPYGEGNSPTHSPSSGRRGTTHAPGPVQGSVT